MKKVRNNFSIPAIIFCLSLVGFGSIACRITERNTATEEVVFDDKSKTNDKNEIVIDDASFEGGGKSVDTFGEKKPDTLLKGNDNSEISTMYDGYGNKLEKRFFSGNSRINYIVVQTATDGTVEIKVYGQSGESAKLPPEMADRVLTARGDEIADTAHIYGTSADRVSIPIVGKNLSLSQPHPNYPTYPAQKMPQTNLEIVNQPVEPETKEESTPPETQNPAPPETKAKPESTPKEINQP
jgi:hypothetical protein